MKTSLAIMVIMVFLVSRAGLVLAQSVPVPSMKNRWGLLPSLTKSRVPVRLAKWRSQGGKKSGGQSVCSGRQKKGGGGL